MQNLDEQKKKLEQKKARMAIEETKLKERKMRTRSLIEKGRLITKAELDHLPTNALYGALLSLKKQLNDNEKIISGWIIKGNAAFNKEKKDTTAIILKFADEPIKEIRDFIRSLGLRFNRFRQEWYGTIENPNELKSKLGDINYELDIIDDLN